jgi:hypothetical protein
MKIYLYKPDNVNLTTASYRTNQKQIRSTVFSAEPFYEIPLVSFKKFRRWSIEGDETDGDILPIMPSFNMLNEHKHKTKKCWYFDQHKVTKWSLFWVQNL